jgi:hypothetical protein
MMTLPSEYASEILFCQRRTRSAAKFLMGSALYVMFRSYGSRTTRTSTPKFVRSVREVLTERGLADAVRAFDEEKEAGAFCGFSGHGLSGVVAPGT